MYDGRKAQFFAFISHKSADKKVAMQLQRFIEFYRLPAAIRKTTNAPKRLGPICSYEVDFSSNPLMDEMKDKLTRSHFLILICSEALATQDRKHINYEIRTFIEQKRAQGIDPLTRIIPVVVSGEFGSGELDCCPEALKELGDNCPIAIDLRKCKNKREAFLHVISGMLDIDYVVIENRDKKRRRRNFTWMCAALALLLAVCVVLWDYFAPKQFHYLDFVMRYGLPEGICPLEKSEWSRMGGHYVITEKENRIISLEYVNAYGKRIDHEAGVRTGDRPSAYKFDYDSSGLSSVTYENKHGRAYFVLQYSSLATADFKDPYDHSQAYKIGSGYENDLSKLLADYNADAHSNISRFAYTYSEDGFVTRVLFHADSSGMLAYDNSIYGFEYTLDSKGRVTDTYFLDALGNRRPNSLGVYRKQFVFDEQDNFTELMYYDSNGDLMAGFDAVTHLVKEFDENHNMTQMYFLDASGESVVVDTYGGAKQIQQVDEHGNLIRVELYDAEGAPTDLAPYCTMQFTYDANGLLTSRTYLDAQDNVVEDPSVQYAQLRYAYDEQGNEREVLFYNAQSELVNNAYGYAREVKEYNDYRQVVKSSYYSADGEPADYRGYGYSTKVTAYDDQGRETSIRYYGKNGEPVNITGPDYEYGYHEAETIYVYGAYTKLCVNFRDAQGNLVDTLSAAMGPTYASVEMYLQNGEITRATYLSADGSIYGITEQETTYNTQAERIVILRTLTSEQVVLSEDAEHFRINGVPLKKSSTTYGYDGKKLEQILRSYREDGSLSVLTYVIYDDDGSVLEEYIWEYDSQGKVINQR